MKKLKLLLLLFISLSFSGLAQDFDYEVSKPYPVIDAATKFYLSKDDQIMSIKSHGKKFAIIQKWDANSMKQISRTEYNDLPDGFLLESFQEFEDNYYMFYSVWDKPNEKEQLFVRRIDFETGKFTDKGTLLLKVDGKVTSANGGGQGFYGAVSASGFGVVDKFNVQASYDESTVLIQYRKKPENRKDKENKDIIGFGVFDSNMEKISVEEVEMPYTEAKMNNLDYSIDSEGRIYVLALVYKDDTQRLTTKDGEVNYEVEVLRIDALSSELTHTPIDLGTDVYLSEVVLFNQKNDEMICAGFYTNNRKTIGDANGVVLFNVDKNAEVTDIRKYEIPLAVLNMYKSERQQKKNEKADEKGKAEFSNLAMRNLITFEDGSTMLIGEQHYVVQHTYVTSNGSTRTYYTYHYNDLLVTKMEPSGELAWMKKLGKKQTGRGQSYYTIQGGMSFKYFRNKDAHYFLFLDNIKNLELGLDEVPDGHTDGAGGFLMAYKVDDNSGDVSKVALFDTRDVHGIDVFQFQVNRIVQTSATEFVIEVYKKKKEDILIKVKVKI